VSIPSNVAEGACPRGSTRAFLNHVSIALGSHGELETCVAIPGNQAYISGVAREESIGFMDSSGRLLHGLYNSLQRVW
jgi:four helix bundle protein